MKKFLKSESMKRRENDSFGLKGNAPYYFRILMGSFMPKLNDREKGVSFSRQRSSQRYFIVEDNLDITLEAVSGCLSPIFIKAQH